MRTGAAGIAARPAADAGTGVVEQSTVTTLVRSIKADAIALLRAAGEPTSFATFLKAVLVNDSLMILITWRLRVLGRRIHIFGLNHVLRRIQTTCYGIELGKDITLGCGVYFVHPVGVVVGGTARIGDRVRFLGANTVGTAKDNGYPVIEDDVIIGAGARILGPIRVGARSIIGANAVVISDVPPDSVMSGIPAVITNCCPERA